MLVGLVGGRLVGSATGHLAGDALADRLWDKVKDYTHEEREQGKLMSLRQTYETAQRQALQQLNAHPNEKERTYLTQRFYQRIQHQVYFAHLAPQQKSAVQGAISHFASRQLPEFAPKEQATIKRFNAHVKAQGEAFWKLNSSMGQGVEVHSEKTKNC